jgi:hypothetical protein
MALTIRFRMYPMAALLAALSLAACSSDEPTGGTPDTGTPVNRAPLAADDAASTAEDTAVAIDVLTNDSDPDGTAQINPATVAVSNANGGAAAADPATGQVTFTPAADFSGPASFQYTVRDSAGAVSNAATVTVTITPVNDAPVANDASFSVDEDTVLSGNLGGSDVESSALSFSRATPAASGTVAVNPDGSFTYTPSLNFSGSDSFTFTVNDGAADSAPATVSIAVRDLPDENPPQPLRAGIAEKPIWVPVGTPLGGYLRPPVGGDWGAALLEGAEDLQKAGEDAFEAGSPEAFINGVAAFIAAVTGPVAGELFDFIPDGADHDGVPLAPVPDELRKVHSPYATFSPPSRGYYDSLIAKAVALYDGDDYVVLVKTDFIGMLDEVVQAVAEEVKTRTTNNPDFPNGAVDLREGLVMSATHTHDGPGALANHSTRYFWLAMDAYQPQLFERLVPQFAELVVNALKDLQPARFGHAAGLEADGNGLPYTLNSFRRCVGDSVNPDDDCYNTDQLLRDEFDNDCDDDGLCNHNLRRRIGVLRVDRLNGETSEPLAVVMNYAAHGIAFDVENMYFSGDVLASAERETESLLKVPLAMLVQNTGGNVSPRADGAPKLQRIERFGKLLAPQVAAIYNGISSFDRAPDLRAVSQRIILDRAHVGYPDADGAHGDGDYPYPWGAAQCNGAEGVPTQEAPVQCIVAPPPDAVDLADNGVAENGAFVPMDTRLTAVKIGSAMLLAQPGEPLSEYGVRILKEAQALGLSRDNTFIWGYSQDHVGYLMADEKADWQTGGTEGTTTFWGWKQGDRLLRANVELMTALRDGSAGPRNEFEANYFYRELYKNVPAPVATPSARPGRLVTQASDTQRFGATTFAFEGGDPVIDLPNVTLLKCSGFGLLCAPALRPNGEPIDNLFEMHLKYELASGAHIWTVEFEAPKDWIAGTYRIRAQGHARGAAETYEIESAAFDVTPSPTLRFGTLQLAGAPYSATLEYTPRPDNYRLIDHLVRSEVAAPVRDGSVTFTCSNGGSEIVARSGATGSTVQYTTLELNCSGGTVTATGSDIHGNTTPDGVPSPADTPDYADLCESYNVSAAGPLCELLRQTETDLRAQCEASGGPARTCTLAGGNLHALLDTCYERTGGDAEGRDDGMPLPACRIADALVLGAAGWCRQVSSATGDAQRAEACALIGGVHLSERELQAYENSWVHTALRLQNRLGYDLPLVHTSVVSTHNSFNATDDNTPPTLSGSDANQFYDIPGQLRMGVRAIEIDVHWMPGTTGGSGSQTREPKVCHGATDSGAPHVGCSNERPLREVLVELREWLDANPGEAIVLYIEDRLNTPVDQEPDPDLPYETAGAVFEEVLGDRIYRPQTHGAACSDIAVIADPNSWLHVTREQILEDGKQVLTYAETCGNGVPVWSGLFHQKTDGDNGAVDQSGDFANVQYDTDCVYPRTVEDSHWTRVWHDGTMVGAMPAIGSTDPYITPQMARELMRCGLNMPSLDLLTPSDGRLEAMVWSWASGEPVADAGPNDCAYHDANGRLKAGDCAAERPLACVSLGPGHAGPSVWTFSAPVMWGGTDCPDGAFSAPGNGYFNEKLKEAKAAAGIAEVWVNYRRVADGPEGWISDHNENLVLPPGSARPGFGIQSQGLLGLVGEFLSELGSAVLALLQADFAAAEAHLVAALNVAVEQGPDTVAGGDGSLLAALADFADALVAFFNTAPDPQQAPATLVTATDALLTDLGEAVGAMQVFDPDNGACAPDNGQWETHSQFIGSLHEHSAYSDGSAAHIPADYFLAGKAAGLDFMGSSEHSDNADIPGAVSRDCQPDEDNLPDSVTDGRAAECLPADDDNPQNDFRKWDATLEQARAATTADFTAFRGFEWTSDRFGHINVFFSRHDWNAKSTEGYTLSMESFWTWFVTRPELGGGSDGIGVFNHPGREDAIESNVPNLDPAYTFNDFEYRPEADLRMVGVETFGKSSDIYDLENGAPPEGWYAYALDRGWHVGPVGAEDEHGTKWAQPDRAKTILVARDRSEGALREAMLARRFYSLRHHHNDVRLTFAGDGEPMGSRLARGPSVPVSLTGAITADPAKIVALEIVTAGGAVVGGRENGTTISRVVSADSTVRWYYLRAIGLDGKPSAYSAPVWVQARGAYPVCGEWLAGDLHVHTWYSLDSMSPDEAPATAGECRANVEQELGEQDDVPGCDLITLGHSTESQFRIASARGLDYLAITDHNDVQSVGDFPAMAAYGVVPVSGYEDSLDGHAQILGPDIVYETTLDARDCGRGDNSPAGVTKLAQCVREDGGVFQVNHPALRSVDFPVDADWEHARDGYGGDPVPDTVEIWNISWLYKPPAPSASSLDDAVAYWEGWLDRGEKVAATGGSDNHWVSTTAVQGNGQPTTWVFATERSEHGVIEGLRAGRTTITHQPPLLNSPRLVLEADADGDGIYEAALGDSVPAGSALRVRVTDAQGAQIRIVSNGGVLAHGPITAVTPVFEYRFTVPPGATWVRAEAVEPDGAEQRATVCDGAVGDRTTYCRNRLAVLAMSSALYLD